ncbi:uncharacterized protein Pyn_09340 [Prunus yedoensis var. nudiflora]|uniref:F-box/kelch-repeat protein n=1 Tax=Prunus yedoensis var. nudiflora TaxID=2094558 RepID=A0A314UY29_PRUYE|nr:uncharacterized protein Pyn_09340 [Prunus yedoensis var. nudiflora]
MGDRYISQISTAAAELTLGQGHTLTMASHQDELLCKILEIEKSLGKIPEMEKTLGQLLDWFKSITQELRLLRPGPPVTTRPLPCTVIENYNPNQEEAYVLYPSLPKDWEHSLMTVNQGESRSVCLFVSSIEDEEHTNAVYEVKFKHGGEVTHEPPVVRHVAKFHGGCRQAARIFNHSKLYCIGKDGGFILDTKTWSNCSSIPPILASKSIETIVCAYDKVYYLACPSSLFSPVMGHSFGRYDSDQKVWEKMTSFPFYDDYDYRMQITGYAVCYDVILISLCGLRNGNFGVVAFHVGRKDWNRVKLDTSVYCAPPFQGRVVVVGDTIYALYGEAKIRAFSFSMGKGDYGGIAYSLSQLFISQGLEFVRPQLPWFNDITQYLVHLGNHDFFHVQTGWCDSRLKVQYLTITTVQIVVGEGGRCMMKTIHSSVHSVDIKGSEWFELLFCFTPECGDYEPIKEESVTSMNQSKQEEITARKLEIEAMQHDETNDVPSGY